MKRPLKIPVRALVEHSQRTGDLTPEFQGANRALEGQKAHKKIQASRPAEYTPEVTVKYVTETEKFSVTIGGRIDGIFVYPDITIIDEIKTTTRDPDHPDERQDPRHWGQAKVYAYIHARQAGLNAIDVQLTYYRLETGKIREFRQRFLLNELVTFFESLLTRFLEWAETLDRHYEARDASIKSLKFPFSQYRPGQRRMALEVYRAIKSDSQLMAEAPTGAGKTMAALFPAIKALGDGFTDSFFYLTAKTTGRFMAQKTLHDLREQGLILKTVTLTAKEKICFSPGSACSGDECPYAKGFYDRIHSAVAAAFGEDALTRETIEKYARTYSVCPFELSLELALWADGLIGDYNYAFDPRVYLRRFFGEESDGRRFVFLGDEAANLVDRAREMFSAELLHPQFLSMRKAVKEEAPTVYRALGKINTQLAALKKECLEAGGTAALETPPPELPPFLRRFIQTAEKWLIQNKPAPFRNELLSLYFETSWFLRVLETFSSDFAACMEIIGKDLRLKLFCIDPSAQMQEALSRPRSAIFFSATLSPMNYYRHLLGISANSGTLRLPSPFPPEHFFLAVADKIVTLYKYREQTKMKVASMIQTMATHQPGNYLAFFPSYEYMRSVYDVFRVMNPFLELQVQTPNMTEEDREAFLSRFDEKNPLTGKTLVGFAVMGGIFGEGVDLTGDRLSGAVIVGVGLPGICLERELIKNHFAELQGSGFEYAYLYPGMNRVLQAAGRVIRSETDQGAVLLVDSRFSTPPYAGLFPPHWHPIAVKDEKQLDEELTQFHKFLAPRNSCAQQPAKPETATPEPT